LISVAADFMIKGMYKDRSDLNNLAVQADVQFKGVNKKVLAGAVASKIASSPVLSKKLIPDGFMEMAQEQDE